MKNKNNIASAIVQYGKNKGVELRPMLDFITTVDCESNGVCRTYSIDWKTDKLKQPTEAELELAEQQAEANELKRAYIMARKKLYPSIEDQLDRLWHGFKDYKALRGSCPECAILDPLANVFEGWFNSIKAIKDRYPKP